MTKTEHIMFIVPIAISLIGIGFLLWVTIQITSTV